MTKQMPNTEKKQKRLFIFTFLVSIFLLFASFYGFYLGWNQVKKEILIVLTFHGVKPNPSLPWEIKYEKLSDMLRQLKKHEFEALSPWDLNKWFNKEIKGGRKFLLTFDDGLKTSAEAIKKLHKDFKIESAFFIVTDLLNTPGYINKEDLLKLASETNCKFGLHGKRHLEVTKILKQNGNLAQELDNAKNELEQLTKQKIDFYAYPFGEYNASATKVLAASSMEYCFTIDALEVSRSESKTIIPRIMYLNAGKDAGNKSPLDWAPPKSASTGSLTITLSTLVMFIGISWLFRSLNIIRVLRKK